MKITRINRRRIRYAIRAACLALACVAGGRLPADPVYTAPYYTLNGSNVTGSGTSSAAYFHDLQGTTNYTVNVQSGATLSDATTNELEIGVGTITNNGTLSSGAMGTYSDEGAVVALGNGTVINRGVMTYTGSNYYGNGVRVDTGAIKNFGTITAEDGYGVTIGSGTITNEASGFITSSGSHRYDAPVYMISGTLINAGKIESTSSRYAVQSENQITVKNSGTISGLYLNTYGIFVEPRSASVKKDATYPSSTIFNSGTITAGSSGSSIYVHGDGVVQNTAGGTIDGYTIITAFGTISNSVGGTVSGCYTQYGTATNAGTVTGFFGTGIEGTVSNSGSVVGQGEYPWGLTTGAGTVTNSGYAAAFSSSSSYFSAAGVYSDDSKTTVVNTVSGTIVAGSSDPTLAPSADGVYFKGTGTLNNAGTIISSGYGVYSIKNGNVTNSGSISAYSGFDGFSAPGVAKRVGFSATSTGATGIYLGGGGYVTNTGSIGTPATETGVEIVGQGSLHNSGMITATACGVLLSGNGSSLATSGGTITAADGDAIDLAGENGTVTVEGSATINGMIEGTNPANGNVLHFSLSGLTSTQAANFKTYVSAHTSSGTYTFVRRGQNVTYTWADFSNVTD